MRLRHASENDHFSSSSPYPLCSLASPRRRLAPRSFLDEPLPENGYVTLSDKPGFGVTLNREGNNLVRPYPHEHKDWKTVEAEKDARTPDQADWLSRAAKIPVTKV